MHVVAACGEASIKDLEKSAESVLYSTFVLGRKNWLFSGTPEGAAASATLFSLIETAKENHLEPYGYLRYLFEKLPITSTDEFHNLLPQNLSPEKLVLPDLASGV